MATIKPVPTAVATLYGHAHAVVWTPVTSADDCAAYESAVAADRSVQVEGTPGGATAAIEGSNDGTNFHTLSDPLGNALNIANTTALKQIAELTRYVKPVITGGDGTQTLTVTLLVRGTL